MKLPTANIPYITPLELPTAQIPIQIHDSH